MTSKQALKKICDNVNMYCIDFDDEIELKSLVEIIKKDLEVLEILRKYVSFEDRDNDDYHPYWLNIYTKDFGYGCILQISDKEADILRHGLEEE